MAALEYLEETVPVVYGAETDWYVAEQALRAIGMDFRRPRQKTGISSE